MDHAAYRALVYQPPPADDAVMDKLIGLVCTRFGVIRPKKSDGGYCFEIDLQRVTVERVADQERIFVSGEVSVGVLNQVGFVKLGRMALSWAAGSGLCIGLHPSRDAVAVVGYGLDSVASAPRDIEGLHLALRRVAGGMLALEREFASRSHNTLAIKPHVDLAARERFMTRIEE